MGFPRKQAYHLYFGIADNGLVEGKFTISLPRASDTRTTPAIVERVQETLSKGADVLELIVEFPDAAPLLDLLASVVRLREVQAEGPFWNTSYDIAGVYFLIESP